MKLKAVEKKKTAGKVWGKAAGVALGASRKAVADEALKKNEDVIQQSKETIETLQDRHAMEKMNQEIKIDNLREENARTKEELQLSRKEKEKESARANNTLKEYANFMKNDPNPNLT